MNTTAYEVLIVGGGISGLTAAWHLKRAGVHVGLLERQSTVGGCTQTQERDGFLLEKGPFNVMVRDPSFEDLLADLSDQVGVVSASPTARKRFIYRSGQLHLVPTNPVSLATTCLLSPRSRARLMAGMVMSKRSPDTEQTIEQAASRRFGPEVADTMVSAVISGIFAGDIRRLSLNACFPAVSTIDARARSLIGYGLVSAFRKKKSKRPRRWRGLVSIDGGLGALTAALGKSLGPDLHSNALVREVRATPDGYDIDFQSSDKPAETLRCRYLVMAAPASEAGRLLGSEIADITATIENASLVVLNLGFRRSEVGHPLDGFGFLVPQNEPGFPLMGVLWSDSIFPHHAPQNRRLIRVFIGGVRDPHAIDRTDDELLTTATAALRGLLNISGDPVLVDFCRYRAAIPQYHLGHQSKIEQLRCIVAKSPRLRVIGNYLEGVSLNDCVRLATNTASELIEQIKPPTHPRQSERPFTNAGAI